MMTIEFGNKNNSRLACTCFSIRSISQHATTQVTQVSSIQNAPVAKFCGLKTS